MAEDEEVDPDRWMSEAAPKVAALVGRLAPIHRRCIQHALQFLREIEPRATRMNPDNLSICFAPCFFRCSDMMLALANAQKEILFTKLLIVTLPLTGACPYNRPCAHQYVGKSQSCMLQGRRKVSSRWSFSTPREGAKVRRCGLALRC